MPSIVQAPSSSRNQFPNSTDFSNKLLDALMESVDVQQKLSSKAMCFAEIRAKLLSLMLNQMNLDEKL